MNKDVKAGLMVAGGAVLVYLLFFRKQQTKQK
jgi:membrane-associated phospholipid phosphatase